MTIKGKIKHIDITREFGSNGFRKREVVVTTSEQYPQTILIEFTQDKTELLNAFQVGQDVVIGINLRGREWVNPQGETKYFNSIVGWKMQNAGNPVPASNSAVDNYKNEQQDDFNHEDDLPF